MEKILEETCPHTESALLGRENEAQIPLCISALAWVIRT